MKFKTLSDLLLLRIIADGQREKRSTAFLSDSPKYFIGPRKLTEYIHLFFFGSYTAPRSIFWHKGFKILPAAVHIAHSSVANVRLADIKEPNTPHRVKHAGLFIIVTVNLVDGGSEQGNGNG